MRTIDGTAVRGLLRSGAEVALVDVRPEAAFATGHPLWAVSMPLGRIELEAWERIPRPDVPVVVLDDGGGLAARAAARLAAVGYREVAVLDGGLAGWVAGGGEVFTDVNVPSKAFGELVEAVCATPSVAAPDLAGMLGDGTDLVVVDVRRPDEYATMSIPGALNLPGGELVDRIAAVAPDPATLVVVNCAGRTRSIVGTQSLRNAGIANPVVALRNGTIGWTLAGLTLDTGRLPTTPGADPAGRRAAAVAARRLAAATGVRLVGPDHGGVLAPPGRSVYRFDVRSAGEYLDGHPPGFAWWPGGQLVQETDHAVAVRGGLIVLAGDATARAPMTASWLAQMGWEVVVADGLVEAARRDGTEVTGPHRPDRPDPPAVPTIEPADLAGRRDAVVVDVAPSPAFVAGHVPGATWTMREDLTATLDRLGCRPGDAPVAVTSPDGLAAAFTVADGDGGGRRLVALAGGTDRWVTDGRPTESGPRGITGAPPDVYVRPYVGTAVDPAAMQAYLDWEHGLPAQLEADGTHRFTVWDGAALRPGHPAAR